MKYILLCLISIQCFGQDTLQKVNAIDVNGRADVWMKMTPIRPDTMPYTVDTVLLDSAKWPNKLGHIIHEIRYVDPRSLIKDTTPYVPLVGTLTVTTGRVGYLAGNPSWMTVSGTNVHLRKRKHRKGKAHRIYHKPSKLQSYKAEADSYAYYNQWFSGTGEVIERDGHLITIRYTTGKFFNKKSKL